MEKELRYTHLKSPAKRFFQGLVRFCIYGALMVAGEVAFYSITKIGRVIPLVSVLFQYDWQVDSRLCLSHIWAVPIQTFFGQASLYMFFVYGAICVFGLEPAYRAMSRYRWPWGLRGLVYMVIILFMECSLGWVLKGSTGYDIWIYGPPGVLFTYTSLAIAPMWFLCGLLSENVIRIVDSLDRWKLMAHGYPLAESPQKPGPRNKIVVLSDLHIGPRNPDGSPAGWFYGIHEVSLAVVLHKIAIDHRVKEMVILGDLFDTWAYPPDVKPDSIAEIVDRWKAAPFMVPFRKCIAELDAVYYIPGNHDQEVTAADVAALSAGGKSLKVMTAEEFNKGRKLACGTKVVMEHGNDGDLFNRPDGAPDSVQGMPFGYFVSRIASDPRFSFDALFRSARSRFRTLTIDGSLVSPVVDALVEIANSRRKGAASLGDQTVIRMPEGFSDVTIGDLKGHYGSLFTGPMGHPDRSLLSLVGKNGLDNYAREKFGSRDPRRYFTRLVFRPVPDLLVILGHTHFVRKEWVLDREVQGIYANTGCFCQNFRQRGPRWVEVTDGPRRCQVKLKRL